MKKYPQLDIRVVEMKTDVIKSALRTGEIDAGIVAGLSDMDEFDRVPLFYEPFHVYVSRESELFEREVIRTSDLSGEQLWLLDEGHCFRDQLVRFCQLKAAKASQMAYHLGSMETFMRMVEGGRGITFIPGLAVLQLSEAQKELVHAFAIPSFSCNQASLLQILYRIPESHLPHDTPISLFKLILTDPFHYPIIIGYFVSVNILKILTSFISLGYLVFIRCHWNSFYNLCCYIHILLIIWFNVLNIDEPLLLELFP